MHEIFFQVLFGCVCFHYIMAHTALRDEELTEYFDNDAVIDQKVKQLASEIKKAGRGGLVVYTGAGVSTSCGINDFRGPNGIWTRQSQIQQGQKVETPSRVIQSSNTSPSPTHMALSTLQTAGYLDTLISTNCDGLHIRSGISPDKILELHGNCYVEACPYCGKTYYRAQPVDLEGFDRSRAILTGRRCDSRSCSSLLRRTDVAFGQSLPDKALQRAERVSKAAKVVLVLGTSLRVTPACELPFRNRRAVTCIVNLQKTPYDKRSKIRIFCPTDVFIEKLCQELGIQISPFVAKDFTQDPAWMESFDKHYTFRSAPDDSWFDSRDDEQALRFLQEQKKGIGIKMVTDASGDVKMERYAIGDSEDEDDDMDGFEIYPKKDCSHVQALDIAALMSNTLDQKRYAKGCEKCAEAEENWLCLTCNRLLCGRMKNQHMLLHATEALENDFRNPSHVVCASLMDLSFWCYACDSYVTSPTLTPIFNSLHQLKFNESALPIHDIM
uniref:protein acetyllysine N-acetyltransferase n=1 Tax=Vannella robusta TaxID=1487602 RepID=A0A7S4I6E9_9EUKA|mmetsp:Transcript_21207/g.26891  ORF Transcript_21207/g.26891 Transcript_21207/m.26891 type:complete len:498 (+) Transcript_21207:36-1529(+)